jgi:hypothetical protein
VGGADTVAMFSLGCLIFQKCYVVAAVRGANEDGCKKIGDKSK